MLSSHLFFCLPLLLAPFTAPSRIVFAMPEDLEMWPYHLSFRFFTMVRSSCTPVAFWRFCCEPPRSPHGLCRKCSEVSYSISSQGFDPSPDFCCHCPALTGIKEGGYGERPHQLNLRCKRDVFVPPYDLQSRKSCCCLGYPGKNLGF